MHLLLFQIFCFLPIFFSSISSANDLSADSHNKLFEISQYPTAKECGSCHIEHYKEWSVSPHSYAQISPVFNSMHAATVKRTNGTSGDFCIRCHTPIGMQIGEPVFQSNFDRKPISNEGVTCIACHRRNEPVGKVSGRFPILPGDIFQTVYGSKGGEELARIIESGEFEVNTDPKKSGRNIHKKAEKFDQLTTPPYCGSCHDVNSAGGFRLEEAFSEYVASPAAARGQTCQDCHMGKEPGKVSGYDFRSVAVVGGKPTKPRKKTNHMFVGPDYSVVHPGIFPHNAAASNFATAREWVQFDFKGGWGTDEFEDNLPNIKFPEKWNSADARFEAREIIDENLDLLKKASEERKKLLQVGYQLGDIKIKTSSSKGIDVDVEFKNGTDGHNVPTGFDAERLVFLRVELIDSNNKIIFKSGDLDPNGDLRDAHSMYVRSGKLEKDKYLFNLQSKFIVNMIRGGDREEILPINNSTSPLPFLRPPTVPLILLGRPNDARKHRQTIAPLASKWANYYVTETELKDAVWPLKLEVKIIAGMVPVNLVHEISEMGFDYNMSAREVAEGVLAGHQILWDRSLKLEKEEK